VIHLYTWKTPNGRKPAIALEELGLAYQAHPVDIGHDEQFDPAFVKLSPNNKIPALVDDDTGVTIFESGAILEYLADQTGKLLPIAGQGRYTVLQWLYWQVGGAGPMFGQLGYFATRAKEKVPAAIARFTEETNRLLDVLDRRLGEAAYLGGEHFSIADIATYPWVIAVLNNVEALADARGRRPSMNRWLDELAERPSVIKGMAVLG
jgi:GST-like protein